MRIALSDSRRANFSMRLRRSMEEPTKIERRIGAENASSDSSTKNAVRFASALSERALASEAMTTGTVSTHGTKHHAIGESGRRLTQPKGGH